MSQQHHPVHRAAADYLELLQAIDSNPQSTVKAQLALRILTEMSNAVSLHRHALEQAGTDESKNDQAVSYMLADYHAIAAEPLYRGQV